MTPLVLAINKSNKDLIAQLIESGVNVNTPSRDVRKLPP